MSVNWYYINCRIFLYGIDHREHVSIQLGINTCTEMEEVVWQQEKEAVHLLQEVQRVAQVHVPPSAQEVHRIEVQEIQKLQAKERTAKQHRVKNRQNSTRILPEK